MKFLDVVQQAKAYLREEHRVSLRGLKRQFEIDDEVLEDLIEELVDVQGVATRAERTLDWVETSPSSAPADPPRQPPAERDPHAYTPKHLADKILRSKSAMEGERKQVTVLFADVKGSLELAEQVDAEEWHGILDRFFQILAAGVHRFEGTVNQYTGDGIMALFGAPISHEDHAQRACFAALHLRDELRAYADELRGQRGLAFSVRIGINSGEVVVGKIGDDLRMDYTAQGHTVGLAARLEQLAEAGTILLSQQTASLVEGYFELEDLGATPLKGVAKPVTTYRLGAQGAARTRLDVSQARGFSRFVGRADEMATLEAAFDRATTGQGQVLGIAAEAGAGKSRLCFQFLERCRTREVTIVEARGVAHGRSIPYLPIRELFRQFYDIREDDTAERAREKIAGRLLLLDESLRDLLPTIFDFLGVVDPNEELPHLDPQARLQQLYGLARGLISSTSSRAPMVSLIEDLHWFDDASLEFLAHIVDAAPHGSLLLLLNFRPEFSAEWMLRSSYQQLPLQPLGHDAVEELVHDLLGTDPSVASLAARVAERTGGNPFFAEEVVLELAESGALSGERGSYRLEGKVEELRVPQSVNALLAARIDRLPERDKRTLQLASVVGHHFDEPTLSLAGEGEELALSLQALCDAEFIYPEALYPIAEYSFKHALTAEVAYKSQLGEARTRSHGAVAKAIEARYADALDEKASVLAHHWEQAGERMHAARAHGRAARREGAVGASGADRHWRKVRSLLTDSDTDTEAVQLRLSACIQIMNLSWRLTIDDDEMAEVFEEGIALAERTKNAVAIASVHTFYGALSITLGKLARAFEHLDVAMAIAEEADDAALLANIRVSYMSGLDQSGRLIEGLALGEITAAAPPAPGMNFWGFDPLLWGQMSYAYIRGLSGELQASKQELLHIQRLAIERGEVECRRAALNYLGMVAWLGGDEAALAGFAEELLALSEKLKLPLYENMTRDVVAMSDLIRGQYESVVASYAGHTRVAGNPQAFIYLAIAYRQQSEFQQAIEILRDEIANRLVNFMFIRLIAQIELVRSLVAQDADANATEIDRALLEAEALLKSTGGRSMAPFLEEARAERARAQGFENEALTHWQDALGLFTELGADGHAARVRANHLA